MRRLLRIGAILIVALLAGCGPFGDANDDSQWSDDVANREGKKRWDSRDEFFAVLFLIGVVGYVRERISKGP